MRRWSTRSGQAPHLALGHAGEAFVERELSQRGWRVLGRRVKTAAGELDLVVTRGRELVCVEVKTSTSVAGLAPVRFRPGNRFRPRHLRRQAGAAREVARSLGWRGPVELSLYEVWSKCGILSGVWKRRLKVLDARPGKWE